MINFVICEDEKVLAEYYQEQIEKFMMKYDIDYKCHYFSCYNAEWKKFARKEQGFKVYLLDIITEDGSGLDAARTIREEYDDWVSMIMIITSHHEYKYEALGKRLMLVDFINKLDNCDQKLNDALLICIKNFDNKYMNLKYTYKNTAYNIELRKILKIEKESDSKRCMITTKHGIYYIQGTLNDISKKLDNRFFKCHRSIIINVEQIESYNMKTNVVKFKNKQEFKEVSRTRKKELYNRVRGIS